MKQEKLIKQYCKQIKEDVHEATLTNLGTGEFVCLCVKFEHSFFYLTN